MSNKKQIQPLRRFPKFQKDPAWNTETLGKLAKRIKKKNNGNMVSRVLTNSAVDGVVDQRDYFDKDIANKSNLEGYFILEEGDYVYNPRTSTSAPVGPISKNKLGTGVMSPLYTVFRFKEKNNDFYEQYFKSTHWHQYMYKISNTGARHDRMSITNDQFMEMPLPYPKPEEQKKIADCLSSIDELIGLETKKLDALKGHKTGLTQQLFPNEEEPLPKFRFSEFRNASKWAIKSGGDLFAQISNKNHDSNLPILAITQEHGAIPRDQINYHVSVSEKSIESYKIVEIGDFIISLRSFQGGIEYSKYKGLCSPAYIILRNKTKALNCYFKHFFKTERFIRDMTKNIEGLRDGKMVSYKQFSELMLPFPRSENEQRKIAECLSTADEMVAAQFQIVETLKEHKKGLMQQLFPSPEEVVR
jgi:type I restriction enzyme S subunit